jgi:hypothetical protein
MKRLLCCFVVLCAAFVGKAQDTLKPLLRKEVFDFQIGDVFQYEHIEENFWVGGKKFYTYSQVKTLSKKIIKDTIFYENEVTEKDLDGNVETYFARDTILHKDSSIFYGLPSYIPVGKEDKFFDQNTIYNDAFKHYSEDSIMCENWISQKEGLGGILAYLSRFKKGLGRVYWNFNNYADPIDHRGKIYTTNIVYYEKTNKTYGTQVDFITALNDKFNEFEISIYPNPASEILHISGLEDDSHDVYYEIYDIHGKKIKQENMPFNTNIDVAYLPKGLYIIHLFNQKNKLPLLQQKIIIH